MKLIKLDEIIGEEILARPIMTDDYQELLSEGVKLKIEYIPKLVDLGITEVFVKDDQADSEKIVILGDEINKKCREQIKDIISKHTYNDQTQDMKQISSTADDIISNIMEEKEVVEQIYDIKERSADIYEHSISTCSLAMLVALKMQLDRETVHDIGVGCLLHDLGLRYITVNFENTSLDDLSDKELDEYKKHPVYGYSAVKNENWLSKTSKEIILCHHERLDGEGYPLHTKDLSVPVKIAAVCDFFDESICGIGYVRLKVHEVVEYLKNYKGISFDTRVVNELLDFTAVYPTNSEVITSDGDKAIVIRQNKSFPERPILQLISDKNGNKYNDTKILDLLVYNNVMIEKVLN